VYRDGQPQWPTLKLQKIFEALRAKEECKNDFEKGNRAKRAKGKG
jgi:hypothetical protein